MLFSNCRSICLFVVWLFVLGRLAIQRSRTLSWPFAKAVPNRKAPVFAGVFAGCAHVLLAAEEWLAQNLRSGGLVRDPDGSKTTPF
ncbi:exported hypothetical protein [Verrucomicrobia bacterium]|nr:exported hypothetical protein [Verrucomicrobiota bacterium]